MLRSKVCLTLTGKTLKEDLEILDKYRNWIDIVELRADYLNQDDRLYIRRFPAMARVPCILSIKRSIDGGTFTAGEANRTMLFARGIAFADQDARKNFAYIDLESDFYVPSIQDAALAFGTRVIRTFHAEKGYIPDIAKKITEMRLTGYEIPKIVCKPCSLSDTINLYRQSKKLANSVCILSGSGPYALPVKILSSKFNSFLTYTVPKELINFKNCSQYLDPQTLIDIFKYNVIDENTKIYGLAGNRNILLPPNDLENIGILSYGMNSIFIPIVSDNVEEVLEFAEELSMPGVALSSPFRESIIPLVGSISSAVGETGACNAILRNGNEWTGHLTSIDTITKVITDFVGRKNLFGVKVAIIGAGAMARVVAYVVKQLRGKACIFNRTAIRAKNIAELYNFKWSSLSEDSQVFIENYSDLIIQTTSVGMLTNHQDEICDPISNYEFMGHEMVLDCVYIPEKTPLLQRAEEAGCKVQNGSNMINLQTHKVFELFTGVPYEQQKSIISK